MHSWHYVVIDSERWAAVLGMSLLHLDKRQLLVFP